MMHIIDDIGRSLRESTLMFWETLWPLVLGFGLSGFVQRFIGKRLIERKLGNHRPATLARASGYGMASSSCSYAASALTKSMFGKGADFISSLVFMISSTNLVIELGIVLVVLIGWQFLIGEFFGGILMIIVLALIGLVAFPKSLVERARAGLDQGKSSNPDQVAQMHVAQSQVTQNQLIQAQPGTTNEAIRSLSAWSDAASFTVSDLKMLRKELLIGYLVAGILATLIPLRFWNSLFVPGNGVWTAIVNAVIGPAIAVLSFVCSIGNVPLAAALWKDGISFGGVISFIFADLITFPLLMIYRKFYGIKLTLRILAVFWLIMSLAGFVIGEVFSALRILPNHQVGQLTLSRFSWNYTSFLNVIFLVIFGVTYWLYRNQSKLGGGSGLAIDPICKMQVNTSNAPARREVAGKIYYFCNPGCADKFSEHPERYIS